MKIAILGYAGQGQSAYEYWNIDGNELTICDRSTKIDVPDGANTRLGEDYLDGLGEFDIIVRTPALHPREIIAANPDVRDILDRITTNTNEFMRVCPTKNIIGVTGTKGKGTTSTLIARMLEATGKRVHLGGNIGIPPLEMLKQNIQPEDWVVLELANFQLIDIKYSPAYAVCLMVMPEHMDWHTDMEEYVAAKQQLFRWQGTDDIAVYYGANKYSSEIVSASPGHKIPYMHAPGATVFMGKVTIDGETICKADEIKLLGKHNWQNACAATTLVWQIAPDAGAIRSVLTSFSGLEHRLELIHELDEVKYYDDSFGTTPETAIVAIEAFTQPKVLILGGSTKGADFKELAETIKKNNVRKVVLMGNTSNQQFRTDSPKIEAALKELGFDDVVSLLRPGGTPMEEVVRAAQQESKPGDIVLLSTACASFDMFKNYKDRGEQFRAAVQSLA